MGKYDHGMAFSSFVNHIAQVYKVSILHVYISSSPVFLFLRRFFLYNRDSVPI